MSKEVVYKTFKDKETSQVWYYMPTKKIKADYPDDHYKVVGEVKKNQISQSEITVVTSSDNNAAELMVKPSGYYKGSRYKTDGYIYTENEDEFIVVKKDNLIKRIVLILLTLALLAGAGYYIWQKMQGPDIDPSIQDYVSNLKRPDNLSETQILVPGYSQVKMSAETSIVSTALFNPDDNPCYFQFNIVLTDSNESLYQSKLVPPGKSLSGIKLNRTMKKGTYNITIRMRSYDLNDYKTEFNGAEAKTKLVVS